MLNFHNEEKNSNKKDVLKQRMSHSLLRGVSFRVWDVEPNNIEYQYDTGHTLSLYLNGGEETFRDDLPNLKGGTGKLCLMPLGHSSRWHSPKPIRIAHLYLPDQLMRQEAERHLDIDSRKMVLRDLVYQSDRELSNEMMSLVDALQHNKAISPLFAEQSMFAVTSLLLERYQDVGQNCSKIHSGLSYSDRHMLKSYIKNNIGQKLSIELLSRLVKLSPYHFARMFKNSFSDSPANYVIRQRVELAKNLLRGTEPLTAIGFECGFCHQSHFINHFKKIVGITPSNYRRLLRK